MKPIIEAKSKKPTYDGITYDSKEEIWFLWYLQELVVAGYIDSFEYQPMRFLLSPPVETPHFQCNAKSIKRKEHRLLQPHYYQADFKIDWNHTAEDKFIGLERRGVDPFKPPFIENSIPDFFEVGSPEHISYVDVKPSFDMNNMTRQFIINQKWVYQSRGIYVQKIIATPKITKGKTRLIKYTPANALFVSTFTPERFRFTDKSMKARKINFYAPSLHDYTVTGGRMPF